MLPIPATSPHPFYREFELTPHVIAYFKDKGYHIRREVRIGFHRADIVAFQEGTATAVELKLKDWKTAFLQAKNYQLGADYVYLAFPYQKEHILIMKRGALLIREGIGLLSVDETTGKVSKPLPAKKSPRKMSSLTLEEVDRFRTRYPTKFHVYR